MKRHSFLTVLFSIIPLITYAHGPTPQKSDQSIHIDATVDATWAVVKNFDRIGDWHPDVKHSQGDGKNQSDSTRTLILENDETIEESLDYYSDKDHEYSYRLKTENVDALPVSSYSSSLQVLEDNGGSLVKWKSRFYRGDTGNSPPDHLNDQAAKTAMDRFITNGLHGLKQSLE